MKVYISGPMTGYDDYNYPLFHEVEKALFTNGLVNDRASGEPFEVCNPANNFNGDQTRPREDYINLALKQVDEADALVLLPGWQQSDGANLEVDRGRAAGKRFFIAIRYGETPYGASWHFARCTDPKPVYETRDSGDRVQWSTGMVREPSAGKTRFDLIMPADQPYERQMVVRFAELMTRGAAKYADRNWENASTTEELDRFREAAVRHFFQWYLAADEVEDHAAAVFFNLMGAEYTSERIRDKDRMAEFHRGNL